MLSSSPEKLATGTLDTVSGSGTDDQQLEPNSVEAMNTVFNENRTPRWKLVLFCMVTVLLYVLTGALAYFLIEGWTFVDSLYVSYSCPNLSMWTVSDGRARQIQGV